MSELVDCINALSAKDIIKSVAKTANGTPFYLQTVGAGGFCAQYQTIYDAFTTPPSDAIAAAQNTMVCGLVDDGVWAKFDIFYMYAQTTNGGGEALINWITPGTYTATIFNNPVFAALEGFTGNGLNTFINCNWKPFSNGVKFKSDDGSFGVYVRTHNANNDVEIGCSDAANGKALQLYSWFAGDNAIMRHQTDLSSAVAPHTDAKGMYVANRVLSTHQDLYYNKVRIINGARPSVGITDFDLYVLAHNNSGTDTARSLKQVSMAFAGGGFTQPDVNNLTDRFEAYMVSNGKGIIP